MFPAHVSALATSEEFACYTLLGKRTSKNPKKSFMGDLPFLYKALTEVAVSSGTTQEELEALLFKQMSNAQSNKYHKERAALSKNKTDDAGPSYLPESQLIIDEIPESSSLL